MNPGAVEESAKGFIEAMKSQPLSLALVAMNLALLILFWFIMDRVNTTRERELNLLYTEHKEVRQLLANCVVPGGPKP